MDKKVLEERIYSLSDDDLVELLQLRELYQEEAVRIAIQEALKKGIISTEEELDLPKFSASQKPSKSFFPRLEKEIHFQKVFNSLIRVLYLISVIPITLGLLQLVDHQTLIGFLLLSGGLSWVFLSRAVQKHKNDQLPLILLILFFTGLTFVVFKEPITKNFSSTDYIISGIMTGLILYILIYLRILLTRKKNKNHISD